MKLLDLFNIAKDKIGINQAKWLIEEKFGVKNYNFDSFEITLNQYLNTLDIIEKISFGYPLQYALGKWEFFGYEFNVGEGVLIPRQDTETICEKVIEIINNRKNMNILDLCSGSGCIAITIDKECQGNNIYAIEKSEIAYKYLVENINLNKSTIKAIKNDIFNKHCYKQLPQFDIIISNPPYLSKKDMDNLQKQVEYEPKMALYGSYDGLMFYEKITKMWKEKLKDNGILIFEIGDKQYEQVYNILLKNNFTNICKVYDLCGIIRVIYGVKK